MPRAWLLPVKVKGLLYVGDLHEVEWVYGPLALVTPIIAKRQRIFT